jgi:hypothetical protein
VHVFFQVREFIAFMRSQAVPFTALQPKVGGAPPERGWRTLDLFGKHVLPAFG